MKIGFSSRMGPRTYWSEWFKERKHFVLEIALGKSYLSYEPERLKKLVESLKDFDLSMHSMTTCLFSNSNNIINEAQQKMLIAEMKIANLIGAKELIFHMPVDIEIQKIENYAKKFFKTANHFSNNFNVNLILENNSKGSFSKEEDFTYFLEKIADINLCLDIGHLNRANYLYKIDINNFVKKLNNKIVHTHIHNNYGKSDSHNSLENGNFNYQKYLPLLKNVKKHIIETDNYKDAITTIKILDFLK